MRRQTLVVAGVLGLLLGTVIGQAVASPPELGASSVSEYADGRASLGFASDPETVQSVYREFGLDPMWGLPFTPEERAEIDRRTALQGLFSESDNLALRELEGFSGFYFDHSADGAPTLLTTSPEATETELVSAIGSDLAAVVRIRPADWTYEQLKWTVDEIGRLAGSDVEIRGFSFATVTHVRLDTPHNRVVVGIEPAMWEAAARNGIWDTFSVPVATEPARPSEPEVCTSRENCHSPLRAGVQVWRTGAGGGTLGFGVWRGNDKQYLTAGHFGWGTFTHSTITIGSTQQTA